jgi:acyl carrier protein
VANNIEQIIKDHIVEKFMHGKPEVELDGDYPLIQEGVIDSLGIFMLIAFLEKEFGVKVKPAEVILDNFETINQIKALVESKL